MVDIFRANIFSSGFFKKAKYLASQPQKAAKAVYFSEVSIISLEMIPMKTGYMEVEDQLKTWKAEHFLTKTMCVNGKPIQNGSCFLITERSYMPLDPTGLIKEKDKEKLFSLKDIAVMRHATAKAQANSNPAGKTPLMEVVVKGCLILVGICIVAAFFMR
jgi:hypothetical protein